MTSSMSIVISIRWVSPFVYPIHTGSDTAAWIKENTTTAVMFACCEEKQREEEMSNIARV